MSDARLWIVAYDVACPKRWRRVFRCLKRWGVPVQYSVFECRLRDTQLRLMMASLEKGIDPDEDRVHAWPACGQCEARARVLGRGGRSGPLPVAWIVSDE